MNRIYNNFFKTIFTYFIAALFICILPMRGWGQIASLELGTTSFSSNTTGATTFTSKDANIASLPATTLTSGQQGQAGGTGYIASKAWNNVSWTNTTYFQFTLTAASGYNISVTAVTLKMYRSTTGPTTIALASDADSYAAIIGGAQALASASNSTITFSGLTLTGKSSITFRVYGYGASAATGTLRIGEGTASSPDITVTGSLVSNAAPEINIKQGLTSYATAGTFGFGSQVSGTNSSATTFTIENTGTATLNLTGSPIVAISGTNASEFSINQSSTSATVTAAGTTTFTITFSPTSQGSKTAAISIANDDATGGENPYVINLTGTGTVSAASDITNTSGYTYSSNIDYASNQTASTLTTGNSIGVNGLTLRDGGATTDADNLGTTLSAITFSTGGSTAIRTAALFDGSTNIKEVAVNGATSIAFTGLSLSASDGSTKDFKLRVTYQSTVSDNQQITFTVSAATASSAASNFAAANAGAAASSIASDVNRLEVTASALAYTQQPPSTISAMAVMSPAVTLAAKDANSNTDLDYTSSVTMSVTTGTTSFDGSATTSGTFSSGAVSFSNLIFNIAASSNKITATSGSLSIESSAFDVTSSLPEINIKQGLTSYATASTFGFGSQTSGTSSSATTFTIENIGSATLNLNGSPIIAISGTNASEFSINQSSTSATVAATDSTTFTITFSPTSQGSKTAAISISNDDATGSENPYVINLTGTGTVSAASDITNTSGYTYSSNIDYANNQTASTLTTGNSIGVNGLTMRDGGATTDADNLGTTLSAITFSTGGSTAIRTAALFDGSTNVKEVSVSGATSIAFTGLSLSASDGSTKDFELRVTYQSTVTDNQQITFTVSAATASSAASNFAAANAGAVASSTTSDINRIEVATSQLVYTQQPSAVNTNASMTPTVTIAAKDTNNNVDLDFTDNVRVSSSGTMTGSPVSVAAVNGVATFSTLTHTSSGSGLTLLAERNNSGAWDLDISSNTFTVSAVSTSTDYFRSAANGSWATIASWESSADGSTNWITATLTPTSSANNITIRNGHTITTSGTITGDQIIIENGGTLTNGSGTSFTLNDGTGDDLTIQNGGILIYNVTSGVPTFSGSAKIRVNNGGIISIQASSLTSNGTGVNSSNHIYDHGSILEWKAASGTPSASGVTYFPNVATDTIPILRITTSPGTPGGGSATVINGKLEVNIAFTFSGAGTKTIRNGIIGSATLTQSTTGQIIISGTNAELGGSGIITLGTNGLLIKLGGSTVLSSNKQIDGNTLTDSGTLVTGTYQLSGSSAVTISSGGILKLGSTSASGALLGNIPNVTPTLSSGSTVELNGASAQFAATNTFSNLTINNTSGVTLNSSSIVSVSGTLALGNNTLNLAGNTLTINGDFTTGTGVIKSNGSGTINIGGTGALTNSLLYDQTTPGTTNRVQYFNLNRGTSTSTGSITLGNTLQITGTLTLSNGTFNTGGTLTLISDASGTARITSIPSTADILGNVKSQRYVPAVVRQYRMISPNTASFTYSDIIDNIFVSGTGGATNGFDPTTNNGSTIYTYQEATTGTGRGWKAATAITNSLSPANGAIVYVRGDRTIASPDWYTINNSTYPSSFGFPAQNAVTLDFNGAINKGTYSPTLTYTNTSSSINDGWNLIGNPYPSQISWNTLSTTNVDPFFYAFNTSTGSYITYSGSEYIASGQAFFIQATGTSPSITFTENCKVSAAPTNYFKTASSPSIELKMTKDSFNSDIAFISFNSSSSKGFVRGEDAIKFSNPKINFGFYIDSNYTVQRNAVPMPSVSDTFILSAYAAVGTYTIQVTNIIAALPTTKNIYLHDLFNNNFVDLRSSPTYTFTITSNTATIGNRFELIILDLSSLPVKWNSFTGEKFNSNDVKLQWQTSDEKNNQHFIIQRSANNISFEEIGLVNGNGSKNIAQNYQFIDELIGQQKATTLYYRLKQVDIDGKFNYSKTISIDFSKSESPLILYPNPANDIVHIKNNFQLHDNIKIEVYNIIGKQCLSTTLFIANEEELSLNISNLTSDIYSVIITENLTGKQTVNKFKKD